MIGQSEQVYIAPPPAPPETRAGYRLLSWLRGGRWVRWLLVSPWILLLAIDLLLIMLVLVVSVLVYLVSGDVSGVSELGDAARTLSILPLFNFAYLLALYLTILLHEGGHLLAGKLVGYSFYLCYLGPLKITQTCTGPRVSWSNRFLFGGAALSCPTDGQRLRLRDFLVTIGGPLANLLTAAPLSWLADRLGGGDLLAFLSFSSAGSAPFSVAPGWGTLAQTALGELFAISALLAVILGLLNLIPMKWGTTVSDGMHLLWNLRGGRSLEFKLASAQVSGCILLGMRSRDWPEALIPKLLALAASPSDHYAAALYAYDLALERGELGQASIFLDAALASGAKPFQPEPVLALEAAYFAARHQADGALARLWLERGKGSEFEAVLRPRAEAARLLLEGRPQEALARANDGLAALPQEASKTLIRLTMEEESLHAMAAEARAGINLSAW